MDTRFDRLVQQLSAAWKPRKAQVRGRAWRCTCGRPVFFRNSQCLGCRAPLGFEPRRGQMVALAPAGDGRAWKVVGDLDPLFGTAARFRRCANFDGPPGCNWLVEADDPVGLCRACRLNRTIPNLADPDNVRYWRLIEQAKRRLVAELLRLGLPVASRLGEDPLRGLAFDFLRAPPGGPPVTIGHAQGVITLDAQEADDLVREQRRTALREPHRTLLGHLRHELGHYYWERLVDGGPWHRAFRALFGDERADYRQALDRYYEAGAPPDWSERHVSAYASAHPWEDWAETWAHYLHMVDGIDTALGFGIDAVDIDLDLQPWDATALWAPGDAGAKDFLALLNAWVELATVLNELARSLGERDFYPYVLSRTAVRKLHFVHLVARDASRAAGTGRRAGG